MKPKTTDFDSLRRLYVDVAGVEPVAHKPMNQAPTVRREISSSDAAIRDALTHNWEAFRASRPDLAAWIEGNASVMSFAADLQRDVRAYGRLTERQAEAVERSIARGCAPATADVDVLSIIQAFDKARANGIEKPSMRLGGFKFKAAGMDSKNAGAIYVTLGETYLGKIVSGKLNLSRDATEVHKAEILAVCANPLDSAVAFGRTTGRCSCCGRELTNDVSIAMGIGPECRENYGL